VYSERICPQSFSTMRKSYEVNSLHFLRIGPTHILPVRLHLNKPTVFNDVQFQEILSSLRELLPTFLTINPFTGELTTEYGTLINSSKPRHHEGTLVQMVFYFIETKPMFKIMHTNNKSCYKFTDPMSGNIKIAPLNSRPQSNPKHQEPQHTDFDFNEENQKSCSTNKENQIEQQSVFNRKRKMSPYNHFPNKKLKSDLLDPLSDLARDSSCWQNFSSLFVMPHTLVVEAYPTYVDIKQYKKNQLFMSHQHQQKQQHQAKISRYFPCSQDLPKSDSDLQRHRSPK